GYLLRLPEAFEPGARRRIFAGEREIDQVPGDRDVVGGLRLEVGDDAVEDADKMKMATVVLPVDEAAEPLAREFQGMGGRQRRKMRVRQMRQHEHRHPKQFVRPMLRSWATDPCQGTLSIMNCR